MKSQYVRGSETSLTAAGVGIRNDVLATKDQEDWVRFHLWSDGEREDTELVWIRFTNRDSAYKNGRDNGCIGLSVCVCVVSDRVLDKGFGRLQLIFCEEGKYPYVPP